MYSLLQIEKMIEKVNMSLRKIGYPHMDQIMVIDHTM